jgi:undecaprenyl-diphosphatase
VLGTLDTALLRRLRTHGHQPPVEVAIRKFSKLGEHGAAWYGLSAAGAVLVPDRRVEFGRAAAIVAGSFVANQAVKFLFRRPRPALEDLPPLIHTLSNRSYPSAHATTSAAGAVAIGKLLPAAAPPLFALALAMAISRPYLGVHYPSDTVAGFALGLAVAELAT